MRGIALDRAIEITLAEMLAKKEEISRSSVQQKLGLSSRSTLVGDRGELIDLWREKQFKELDASDSKYHRLSLQERCEKLAQENKQLNKRLDHLTETLQKIVVNAEKYGLSPELMLEPLAPKSR